MGFIWFWIVAVMIALYVVLGVTLVVALQAMSRRWRSEGGQDDAGPYSPETVPPPDLAAGAAG